MNKVLCIGEALIDMICTDKGQSLSQGQHFLKKPGGAPANVAAAIAALGGKAALAAKVGIDPFGKHLVEVLQSFGVSTEWVWQDKDWFTTFAFVSLLEKGERDFYFNRGADGQLNANEIENIDLRDYSIVHFGSATAFLPGPLQSAYTVLFQKSKQSGLFTSFDPNYRHLLVGHMRESFIEQAWKFLSDCQFFKLSDEEALLLTSRTSVDDAASMLLGKTKAVFTITLGKEGALLGINGKTEIVEGIEIDPVDTTGAGDAFTGAVLYQLSEKTADEIKRLDIEAWREIVFNANKAGAYTCEHYGAMEAMRFLDKLKI